MKKECYISFANQAEGLTKGGIPFDFVTLQEESFTMPKNDADLIAITVVAIQNRILALKGLCGDISGLLYFISENHIDDNAKEIAELLSNRMDKFQEEMYEFFHGDNSDWRDTSWNGLAELLADGKRQTLFLPALRNQFAEAVKCEEDMTRVKFEQEFQDMVNYLRDKYNLSEHFK